MKNLTPAMLISAAAVTSAAILGACNNRNRTASVTDTDAPSTDPVVRNGAVVTPQSGLTSSRDEIATSPATSRDRAAAPASSPSEARAADPTMRVAGAENPDPSTPAEPTRDQFVFEGSTSNASSTTPTDRYGRVDAAPNSVESDPYAREDRSPARAWSRAESPGRDDTTRLSTNTQRPAEMPLDRELPGSDTARERTLGPSPTRVTSDMPEADPADTDSVYTQRALTDDRSPAINWDRDTARTVAPDNSKAPDPPTPATPTRESFQFDTATTDTAAASRPSDVDRRTTARVDDPARERVLTDTEDDLWEPAESRRAPVSDAAVDHRAHKVAPDNAKAPDPPTPVTPTSEAFDFSNSTTEPREFDPTATTPAAPVKAEDEARSGQPAADRPADRARMNRSSRLTDAGHEPALYESGGEVYPVSPESRILAIIHAKNVDEIAMGRLALERSSSPDVQAYARELISEHERADQRVRELAAEKGYALAEPALVKRMLARENGEQTPAPAHDHLKRLEGQAFDTAFTDHMTKGHAELITLMRHAAPSIQDDDVFAFLVDLIPTIEDHEAAAYQLTANY